VVQRVRSAEVTVDGETVGAVGRGLCVLLGVTHGDNPATAAAMARKVWGLRLFPDEAGRMDRSAEDVGAEVLVVSQFTLYGDTSRGRRPGWSAAAPGAVAEPLVDTVVQELTAVGARVATGRFGAQMEVSLVNDGPVTVIVEL
jgi:D-tyrosyl-tRNA(Tyr) deacylase